MGSKRVGRDLAIEHAAILKHRNDMRQDIKLEKEKSTEDKL